MMMRDVPLYLDNILNRAEKSKKQTVNLSDEEFKAIYTARDILKGIIKKPIR